MASRSPAPLPLMIDPIQMIDRHPVPAVLITVVALAALVPVGFLARRILRAVARLRASPIGNDHVLGKTNRWANNSCWNVNTDSGVHTHMEVKNTETASCYNPLTRGGTYSYGQWIGNLVPIRNLLRDRYQTRQQSLSTRHPAPSVTAPRKVLPSPRTQAQPTRFRPTTRPSSDSRSSSPAEATPPLS
ncbi:MAG: hypothetical protein JWN52_3772 [Actinomycetia bacterium]|nr:hypothetical protein [Actinomycetes bacterium]